MMNAIQPNSDTDVKGVLLPVQSLPKCPIFFIIHGLQQAWLPCPSPPLEFTQLMSSLSW